MAARVLLRASALGLTAGAAGSLYAVATCRTPELVSPVTAPLRHRLLDSAQGLQSALLRARPLNGAHLRDVCARAEIDLKRVDAVGPEGDPAAATDLRLLLALLAARDGRADKALRLYAEAARDSPFDPRPRVLAFHLCGMSGRRNAARWWYAAYCHLVPEEEILDPNFPGFESEELTSLINELVVAASLGGLCHYDRPAVRILVMLRANCELEEHLLDALQDKSLSMGERLRLRALLAYLNTKVGFMEREESRIIERNDDARR